jgi:hypothetical protein
VVNKKSLFFFTLSGDFFGGHCTVHGNDVALPWEQAVRKIALKLPEM